MISFYILEVKNVSTVLVSVLSEANPELLGVSSASNTIRASVVLLSQLHS